MSRISKSEPCHVHYAGWVKFLFEIYMNAWIYLSPRSPRASGRVSFPVVALLWNGVAWSLKAPHMRPPNKSAWCTSRTMDGGRGTGNDLASLLEGPEQSLQSGVPGWGFNRPSLCIRCASCDEPLKGGSSSGWEIAIALHRCWRGFGLSKRDLQVSGFNGIALLHSALL